MSDTKLKACPFCGSEPTQTWEKYLSGSELYIRCEKCLGASFQYSDPEKAIASWESRPREDALVEALEVIIAATDEDTRPYKGWMPIRELADKWGIYNEDFQDAARLIPVIARAALARVREGE